MTEKHAGGRPRKFQSVEEMDRWLRINTMDWLTS